MDMKLHHLLKQLPHFIITSSGPRLDVGKAILRTKKNIYSLLAVITVNIPTFTQYICPLSRSNNVYFHITNNRLFHYIGYMIYIAFYAHLNVEVGTRLEFKHIHNWEH